jgi:hypothetical protein
MASLMEDPEAVGENIRRKTKKDARKKTKI